MMLLTVLLLTLFVVIISSHDFDQLLRRLCDKVELYESYELLKSWNQRHDPMQLFALAALELILNSNIDRAISLHKLAKSLSTNVMPPLAEMHLKGLACGGLGDLYYVAAVITKQMVDLSNKIGSTKQINSSDLWLESLGTLITLTADSGLSDAAETHWQVARAISKTTARPSGLLSLMFRGVLLTPGVYNSVDHIIETRERLQQRQHELLDMIHTDGYTLQKLDEFSLSTTFYLVYQGYSDSKFLSSLHNAYGTSYAALLQSPAMQRGISYSIAETASIPIRVGFVSNYFRRHSICKLFCGLVQGLAKQECTHSHTQAAFEIFLFSTVPVNKDDDMTRSLLQQQNASANFHYVYLDKMLLSNRHMVTSRRIDVLVYLDIGMDASSIIWAASRLAPVQLCTWGHPSSSGLQQMDYFISSQSYHRYAVQSVLYTNSTLVDHFSEVQDLYSEQLVLLDSVGFSFPQLNELLPAAALNAASTGLYPIVLRDESYLNILEQHMLSWESEKAKIALLGLLEDIRRGNRLLLCPQYLPKMHPAMDDILVTLLLASSSHKLVMLESEKKSAWRVALLKRWHKALVEQLLLSSSSSSSSSSNMDSLATGEASKQASKVLAEQVLWLPLLSPAQYLLMLSMGTVMLDPFPFGGGVTTLEALQVCTPVVTLPSMQHVPQLAAGILEALLRPNRSIVAHANSTLDAEKAYWMMVAQSKQEYIAKIFELISADAIQQQAMRAMLCNKREELFGLQSRVSRDSIADWARVLTRLHRQQ